VADTRKYAAVPNFFGSKNLVHFESHNVFAGNPLLPTEPGEAQQAELFIQTELACKSWHQISWAL
jgi:hypothetical protein